MERVRSDMIIVLYKYNEAIKTFNPTDLAEFIASRWGKVVMGHWGIHPIKCVNPGTKKNYTNIICHSFLLLPSFLLVNKNQFF